MTADEAIKLLRDVEKCHCVKDLGYYETAVQLGIQALKRVKANRVRRLANFTEPLLGETLE